MRHVCRCLLVDKVHYILTEGSRAHTTCQDWLTDRMILWPLSCLRILPMMSCAATGKVCALRCSLCRHVCLCVNGFLSAPAYISAYGNMRPYVEMLG